jgi:NAD-dependent dihydropyrimidine dehydrogenase PreA subunit
MMPHDPKDEDDEADDCTLPVDPLPSPFILSNGDSGVDTMQTSLGGMPTVPFSPNDVVAEEHEETPHEVVPDGEAEDEDKDDKQKKTWVWWNTDSCVGCVGLLILIIWAIYQALSEVGKGLSRVSDFLSHLH